MYPMNEDEEKKRQASFIPPEDAELETITLGNKTEGSTNGFSPHPISSLKIIPSFMKYLKEKGYEEKYDQEKNVYTFAKGGGDKPTTINCHPAGENGIPEAKITFKNASFEQMQEIFSGVKQALEEAHQLRYKDAAPPVPFNISDYKVNFKAANEEDMLKVQTICKDLGIECKGSVKPSAQPPTTPRSMPDMSRMPGMGPGGMS